MTEQPLLPMAWRARMARAGLHDLRPWDSPDHGWVDPMDDPEIRNAARQFLTALWSAKVEG